MRAENISVFISSEFEPALITPLDLSFDASLRRLRSQMPIAIDAMHATVANMDTTMATVDPEVGSLGGDISTTAVVDEVLETSVEPTVVWLLVTDVNLLLPNNK